LASSGVCITKLFQKAVIATVARDSKNNLAIVVNVANWDTTLVFIKAIGGLYLPGWFPVRNSIVFALFEQKYIWCLTLKIS